MADEFARVLRHRDCMHGLQISIDGADMSHDLQVLMMNEAKCSRLSGGLFVGRLEGGFPPKVEEFERNGENAPT